MHECLFCPHTFETAAAKDDHVLEHFAQEICLECNRNLVRIGSSLYVKHDGSICSMKAPKPEKTVETQDDGQCVLNIEHMTVESIKSEQQNMTENSNESIDFDLLDGFDNQTAITESDGQSISSDIEFKLQDMLCKHKIQINSEKIEQVSIDAENAVDVAENKITCEICGIFFGQKQSLLKHSILKHSLPDVIFCNICARLFATITDRDTHRSECSVRRRKQTNSKSHPDLRCDICDTKCDTEKTFRSHMMQIHLRRVVSVKCKYCFSLFLKKSWLKEHRCPKKLAKIGKQSQVPRKRRGAGEIQCNLCFTKFQSNHNLRNHMIRKHDSTKEKFECKTCKAMFMKESTLMNHNCPKGTYTCNICGEKLQRLVSLQMHQIRFHSAPDVIFCDICTKLFATVDERDSHRWECIMRKRLPGIENFSKFECYICKKRMATKGNLLAHMRRKHDPDVDRFKCKTCSHIFMRELSLRQHQCKGRPKGTTSAIYTERIPCEICGKLVSRGHIDSHRIALHSEPNTIYCRICFKVFNTVDERNRHHAECYAKKNMKCSCGICGAVLSSARTLNRHKISLHSEPGTIFCKTCVKKFKTTDELNAHIPECTLKRKLYKIKSND